MVIVVSLGMFTGAKQKFPKSLLSNYSKLKICLWKENNVPFFFNKIVTPHHSLFYSPSQTHCQYSTTAQMSHIKCNDWQCCATVATDRLHSSQLLKPHSLSDKTALDSPLDMAFIHQKYFWQLLTKRRISKMFCVYDSTDSYSECAWLIVYLDIKNVMRSISLSITFTSLMVQEAMGQ